jgi:TatD DNase family protein
MRQKTVTTYYNIHTHKPTGAPDVTELVNVYQHFAAAMQYPACSVGIHPWYLHDRESQLNELNKIALQPNVLAIGECGLDKVTKTSWELQLTIFRAQIDLAITLHKPLITHCVRAYHEVTLELKAKHVAVPAIFHGFNKSEAVAQQLLGNGWYLSFGAALIDGHEQVARVLAAVPDDRFFLETDDADISINEIYAAAARIRNCTADAIILQQQHNFKTVFNR